ncbi:AfsR/SARP family transcriptional regulator [Actinoplanes xinjiangensis]|uniref:AfsR/SARP family transcriptional regulator n=1 Tax=Actinoplanes xinjiangensis TaxID=512350 RepID=UPI00130E76DB|nr:BTAD domain-containing putative transcriptional regulator [Actinoplanes xinjiangensis]
MKAAESARRPAEAGRFLAEAARIWADVGDPVAAARVDLALARTGAGRAPIAARVVAEHRLRALGADPSSGTRSLAGAPARPPVTVRMLGSFAVLHGDDPVPVAAWQSRKARDLLKLVIARRGRPITRDALGEALWPGEAKVANRLSITLSVLRGVLDPDRGRPADHYVTAGAGGLAYDPHTLAVDVDAFLQLAHAGTAAAREGRADEARVLLSAADLAYTGEVLADEPDFSGAGPLRAEVRLARLAVMRALGGVHVAAGDLDSAAWAWSRLLADDPYDEDVALRLVTELTAAGRHGEAARQRRRYEVRMRELGIPTHSGPKAASDDRWRDFWNRMDFDGRVGVHGARRYERGRPESAQRDHHPGRRDRARRPGEGGVHHVGRPADRRRSGRVRRRWLVADDGRAGAVRRTDPAQRLARQSPPRSAQTRAATGGTADRGAGRVRRGGRPVNDDDNPVEALIRHNIEAHDTPQVRFLQNLMTVLLVVSGAGAMAAGVWLLVTGTLMISGVMAILVGAFLIFWGPYSRRQIRADTERKAAAVRYQLDQAKAWRRHNGL